MSEKEQSNLEIRQIKLWEVPKLLAFRAEYDYKVPFLPESSKTDKDSALYHILKMLWHRKRMATFVAVRGREVLGYISFVSGKYKRSQGNAYLVSAAVKKSERGQGIGSSLFQAVEEYARAQGSRRIEFDVFSANKRALELYKRLGYEIEGVKRRAVENERGSDDLIFMAKFIQ